MKAGDKVKVGQAILSVEGGAEAGAAKSVPARSGRQGAESRASPARAPLPKAPQPAHRQRGAPAASAPEAEASEPEAPDAAADDAGGQQSATNVVDIKPTAARVRPAEPAAAELPVAPAAPSVRRLARELGVDIDRVQRHRTGGTHLDRGREGVREAPARGRRRRPCGAGRASRSRISRDGARSIAQPMRAVRRKTAEHLSAAWAPCPRDAARHGGHHGARRGAEAVREAGRGFRRRSDADGDRREGGRPRR